MRVYGGGRCAVLIVVLFIPTFVGCQKAEEPAQPVQAAPVVPSKVYTDELHERHTWLKLLWTEQYAELDKTITAAYMQRDRGEVSSNRLRGRFWQLQHADPAFEPKFDAWVSQRKSAYAYLARGLFWLQRADELRGSGLARKLSDEKWTQVRALAHRGVDDMESALELDGHCAMCVGGKIWAAYFLGYRDRSLIDTALSLDPTLWQPVGAHFGLLDPNWEGSEEEMLAFIQKMDAGSETKHFVPELNARFHVQRGLDLQSDGDISGAISEYEKAISFYPDSDALKNVAELYARQGHLIKAANALERNLQEDPWDLYTLEALAQAYLGQGEKAKGIAMLEKRDELIARFRAGE